MMGLRPFGGKQPRSARGAAAVLACGPTKKSGKVRRAANHASPVKRLYGGKAATYLGLASSLDRSCYKRYVVCERRAQFLEDPGHHGRVLREFGSATRSRAPNGPPRNRHRAGYRSPICLNERRNTKNLARETRILCPVGRTSLSPLV
jgi:hypothetical protein